MACCNEQFVEDALRCAAELTSLAESGETEHHDDGCVVLSGVIRDCAYTIRRRAELEREILRATGAWEGRKRAGADAG